jgi:hypothetical protein
MSTIVSGPTALGDNAARQLANATKTVPQLSTITPRWLTHLLQWVPVEAGIYRLNQVKNPEDVRVTCTHAKTKDAAHHLRPVRRKAARILPQRDHRARRAYASPTSTAARTTRSRNSCA